MFEMYIYMYLHIIVRTNKQDYMMDCMQANKAHIYKYVTYILHSHAVITIQRCLVMLVM